MCGQKYVADYTKSGKGFANSIPIPAKRGTKFISLLGSIKESFHHSFTLMSEKMN
ncbi:hypothetical protein AC140_39200 [Bacteroides fragilis]|nr:hypothetical protein AC140_39200 [Bacteroides fragilis]